MMNDNNSQMTSKGKNNAMEEMPWSIIESYFDGQHFHRLSHLAVK